MEYQEPGNPMAHLTGLKHKLLQRVLHFNCQVRQVFTLALVALVCVGCTKTYQVSVIYVNMSTNDVMLKIMRGIEPDMSPGNVAAATHGGDRLDAVTVNFFQRITLKPLIEIIWDENGIQHKATVDSGLAGSSAIIGTGSIKFVYNGGDRWVIEVAH